MTVCVTDTKSINYIGFEYASQPGISDKEKEYRLHFVVVGGGPTVSIYAYIHTILL